MEEKTKVVNSKNQKEYIYAHGRRKEAVARVRLFNGKGDLIVNNKPIGEYFPSETFKSLYMKPFYLTKMEDKFHATIKVSGSGKKGQLDAIIHGLANTLIKADPQFRPILKKAGLLKRDPRVKERRKYGRAQKARKGKQSPKR